MSAGALTLEEVAARGWPAPDTEWLGRWLLRAGDGWTRRANSALVLGSPGIDLDAALARTAAWYQARGLRPAFSVPLPAHRELDDALAAGGWTAELDTDVLTAELLTAELARPDAVRDNEIRLHDRPPPGWAAVYRGTAPLPPVAMRILTAPPTVTFASTVDSAGTVVATGRGVVVDGWLGIAAIEVAPSHRGCGLARRVTKALQRWGSGRGADRCYLQVATNNAPALALYASLGFTRHHTYRQRTAG